MSVLHMLLLTLFYCPLASQSDNVHVERTSVLHGLPNGYIRAIMEDSYGYLWFGTREGIFRYDGYEFKAYRHDIFDQQSLSHPDINAIIEDSTGSLWVATAHGLSFLDRRTGKFQRFYPTLDTSLEARQQNSISCIIALSADQLLLGIRNKLFLFDKRKKSFTLIPIIAEEGKEFFIRSFLADQDKIWISTNNGLLTYNLSDGVCSDFTQTPPALVNAPISGLAHGPNGGLWVSTSQELIEYYPSKNQNRSIAIPAYLATSSINHLFKAKDGKLWLSFYQNGLAMYDPSNNAWNHYTHSSILMNSLNNNTVTRIFEDRFANIWVVTINGTSILRLDQSGFSEAQKI